MKSKYNGVVVGSDSVLDQSKIAADTDAQTNLKSANSATSEECNANEVNKTNEGLSMSSWQNSAIKALSPRTKSRTRTTRKDKGNLVNEFSENQR